MSRDDFDKKIVLVLAQRAAYQCSNPDCRRLTIGQHTDPQRSLTYGIAADICAAAPGGPRFDVNQTRDERKSIYNAIWVCHNCSDIIDKDEIAYTVSLLQEWKHRHEEFVRSGGWQTNSSFQVVQESNRLLTGVSEQISRLVSISDTGKPDMGSEQAWHQRIDVPRNLLLEGQYQAARPLLLNLHSEAQSSQLSPAVLSRIANNLGVCALGVDEFEQAQIYFREALKQEPNSAKTLSNLAMVALMQGSFEQAIELSNQAWEKDSSDPNVLGVYLQALNLNGRSVEAQQLLRDHAWALERDECAAPIAVIKRDADNFDEAEIFARRALKTHPNDAQAYMLLASILVSSVQNELGTLVGPYPHLSQAMIADLEGIEQLYCASVRLCEQQGNYTSLHSALVSRAVRKLLNRIKKVCKIATGITLTAISPWCVGEQSTYPFRQ